MEWKETSKPTNIYMHLNGVFFHLNILKHWLNEEKKKSPLLVWKHIFTFKLTLYSGWSGWGKWSSCSKSCKGIQQRHRHCLSSQQNKTNSQMQTDENKNDAVEKSDSTRQPNQQLCNGYNIEQRECNLFECQGRMNKIENFHLFFIIFCSFVAFWFSIQFFLFICLVM